jgi:2-oxoglutarate ferredoxin oxidoreductase subunit alpha
VLLFLDGELGHMRERLVIPAEDELEVVDRTRAERSQDYKPFATDASLVPAFAPFGTGFHTYVTGLTHNEQGLPKASSAAIHDRLVRRLAAKITTHIDAITRYDEYCVDDCEILLIAYGIVARTCRDVVAEGRRRGIKVGLLRLITIWPFPEAVVARWAARVQAMLVPEMNLGQIVHPIREAVAGRCMVSLLAKIGGELHTPAELLEALEELRCQPR